MTLRLIRSRVRVCKINCTRRVALGVVLSMVRHLERYYHSHASSGDLSLGYHRCQEGYFRAYGFANQYFASGKCKKSACVFLFSLGLSSE